jgi:hypothetical protein
MGVMARARTWLAGLMLALCPAAFALNPALDVSQYAHASWKVRDGFFEGGINDIVQTFDGYLWLAALSSFAVPPPGWEASSQAERNGRCSRLDNAPNSLDAPARLPRTGQLEPLR